MYKVEIDNSFETLKECLPLGEKQYYEIVNKSASIPFKPNFGLLASAIVAGQMFVVTARDSGKLIGYCAVAVTPDFLTEGNVANEVAMFVDKDYRKNNIFSDMLVIAESEAKTRGANLILLTFPKGPTENLPSKYGYVPSGIVHEKIIGD